MGVGRFPFVASPDSGSIFVVGGRGCRSASTFAWDFWDVVTVFVAVEFYLVVCYRWASLGLGGSAL